MQKKVYRLESQFQSYVKRRLSEIDGLFFFVKEAKSLRGLPDIIGCYKGRFFGWELKRSKSEASKTTGRIVLQRHKLLQIQQSGGIGEIVHPENLEQCLADLLESDQLL
jgi:penicillin-binding protein-related factor A (putative recombinase)